MKFSIFFEMQLSHPTPESEARIFHECAEQAVLADELGYHAVWEVEHHGLYEYSHSAAPEIFLAYIAGRTRRIRLGHGVVLLPFRYNHPQRVAERIATLDILSNGRVNFGTGKSASATEIGSFQIDRQRLTEEWEEALEIIPRMWSESSFSHKSRFFDIPPTQVVPKPVQKPHPPMFAACAKPDSVLHVGKLGLGALNFAFGNDDYLEQKVTQYRAAVAEAKPKYRSVNNHFACTPATLVLPDDKRACEYGIRGMRFFTESMNRYYTFGDRPQGALNVPRDFLHADELRDAMAMRNQDGSTLAMVVGDAAAARETIQRFVDIGVDELILVMQMGTVPHELILQSLRTFAEQVMPHFC
jgi:alkanesulfonate monooxygenase SsuD/methylene tetrahydromethanopterin reductase-like flavin-dependent oxidoreductase (luciferase family)